MSDTQYYVDQNGHQYYLDQNGQPVYIDPVQPVQPQAPAPVPQVSAEVPQPAISQQPAPQVQPVIQQPLQAEPSLGGSFAPPEDYGKAAPVGGVENGAANTMYADQYGAEPVAAKSKLPMILALVGSIGIGGGGAYVYSNNLAGGLDQVATGIPFIKASSQSAKVKPENTGGKIFQNTNKRIYDRLEGQSAPQKEALRAKAESPEKATIAKATAARASAQKHVKTARTIVGGAPKPVKTYVVLPDGRVIKPGMNNAPAKAVTPAPTPVSAPKKIAKVVAPAKPVGDQRLFVNNTNVGTGLRGAAPQRAASTTSKNGKFKYKPRRVASAAPMAAPVAATRASGTISSGDFLLQLAARRSQDGAMQAFKKLKSQYSAILGSYTSDIQKADLGAKGIYYRIRVGPIESRSAAMDVCQQLKDAGGDCLIRQK